MRFVRFFFVFFLSGLIFAGTAAVASAASPPAQFVIASSDISFSSSSASGATFTVSLINLTEQDAVITAQPVHASASCSATPDPEILPAATEQNVTVTLRGCVLPDQGGYPVTLRVAGQVLPALSVTPASAAAPDWTLLWAFPIAIAAALITLVATGAVESHREKEGRRSRWKWWRGDRLALAPNWSLKDSWASNVTLIGAAFAGVFGSSEDLKALLGTDGTSVFALTVVAGAIAAGIVGAAPLVLAIAQSSGGITPLALTLGAGLTVGAAGGELAVITLGARELNIGGLQDAMLPALAGGVVVLLAYTVRTMQGSLARKPSHPRTVGQMPPKQPDKPGELSYERVAELATELPNMYIPAAFAQAYGEKLADPAVTDRYSAVF